MLTARVRMTSRVLFLGLVSLVGFGCGSAENSDDQDPGCNETLDLCTGEQICVDGTCEAAFPRVYTLRVEMVQYPPMDPAANDCWDTPCSPPDPFFAVEVNGQDVGRTEAVQDQNAVVVTATFDVSLIAGATLIAGLIDEDIAEDDVIGACRLNPVTPELLRGRVMSCTASGGAFSMRFRLDPKQ